VTCVWGYSLEFGHNTQQKSIRTSYTLLLVAGVPFLKCPDLTSMNFRVAFVIMLCTISEGQIHHTKVYWGSGCVAPCILRVGTRCKSGQFHAPAALFLGKDHDTLGYKAEWAPRARLDTIVRSLPSHCQKSNLQHSELHWL